MATQQKIQCMVCDESPIVKIPFAKEFYEGKEIYCPSCEKWLATCWKDFDDTLYWNFEVDEYCDDEGVIYKDYPIKHLKI